MALALLLAQASSTPAALAGDAPALPFSHSWTAGDHDTAVLAADLAELARRAAGPTQIVWIGLTDKAVRSDREYRHALQAVEAALTPAARARRRRAGGPWIVDYLDVPVPPAYVEAIRATGARVRVVSRWLGAVSAEATRAELERLAGLPFVSRLTPVARSRRLEPPPRGAPARPPDRPGTDALDYGPSLGQLEEIQVTDMHALGYTGAGVIVCMLDTGYFKDHETFDAIRSSGRLLAEHDFIHGDGETQNEPGDHEAQHNHGTLTWSALAGETPAELFGPAYGASFVLAKTEDITDEQPIEEDWYIAGLEFADSLGAQVVSSSLGYKDWYTYDDMDGDTAVTTIGVDIAASRNILVATAAGNEGTSAWHYIIAPADADSAIACGAMHADGSVADFSSWGPTVDGRIKPEVCARGVQTHCASAGAVNDYTDAGGTSLATPLVAGSAALLFEAHPDWSAMEVRDALMVTATNAANPDNHQGWGRIRVLDAFLLGVLAVDPTPAPGLPVTLRTAPQPLGAAGSIELMVPGGDRRPVEVRLYDVTGRMRGVLMRAELPPGAHRLRWTGDDDAGHRLPPGVYLLQARVGADVGVARVVIAR